MIDGEEKLFDSLEAVLDTDMTRKEDQALLSGFINSLPHDKPVDWSRDAADDEDD
jgi:hypothetical protein